MPAKIEIDNERNTAMEGEKVQIRVKLYYDSASEDDVLPLIQMLCCLIARGPPAISERVNKQQNPVNRRNYGYGQSSTRKWLVRGPVS